LPQDQELYVLAQSHARIHKERAMRRRKLKWLCARLKEIVAMDLDREELLMKLGAARARAWANMQENGTCRFFARVVGRPAARPSPSQREGGSPG
jgi:hypothetical protein